MPALHVSRVRLEVGAKGVELVVKVEVEVEGLQVLHREDAGHGAREFAEGVEDILRLKRDAVFEALVMGSGGAPHSGAVLPRPGRVWVIGTARPELSLRHGL